MGEYHAVPGAAVMCQELMKVYAFRCCMETKALYRYHEGIYIDDGEEYLAEEIIKKFPEATKHRVNETIFKVRALTRTPREWFEGEAKHVHLMNGVLDLETLELIEHSPELPSLIKLPVVYDPGAASDRWSEFVAEVMYAEDVPVLQEIFGYCLLRDYPIHKALMLHGSGRNGKSVCLSVLREMLGRKNCSAIPLQKLEENDFAASHLCGKLANICPDLSKRALYNSGMFKALTGGDIVDTERKHGAHFEFVNTAKMIFAANEIPVSKDDTDAYFRRWLIVTFPNQFDDDARDPHLTKKLTAPGVLSAVLNWALEGLLRLMAHGRFSCSRSTEEVREEYKRRSDPVSAFATDHVVELAENWVAKDELYTHYVEYCMGRKLEVCANNAFARRLKMVSPKVRDDRRKVGRKRIRVWVGIAYEVAVTVADDDEELAPAPVPKPVTRTLFDDEDDDSAAAICQGCGERRLVAEYFHGAPLCSSCVDD